MLFSTRWLTSETEHSTQMPRVPESVTVAELSLINGVSPLAEKAKASRMGNNMPFILILSIIKARSLATSEMASIFGSLLQNIIKLTITGYHIHNSMSSETRNIIAWCVLRKRREPGPKVIFPALKPGKDHFWRYFLQCISLPVTVRKIPRSPGRDRWGARCGAVQYPPGLLCSCLSWRWNTAPDRCAGPCRDGMRQRGSPTRKRCFPAGRTGERCRADQIGRATCRERVEMAVDTEQIRMKKIKERNNIHERKQHISAKQVL